MRVWILACEPPWQEGHVIGVYASPESALPDWQRYADGKPLPEPDPDGVYHSITDALRLYPCAVTGA